MSLDDWLTNESLKSQGTVKDEYLVDPLTAIGFGVPSFATFYPQCHSVFGFYDGDIKNSFPDNLRYSVIGWYSDPNDDFLKKHLDQVKNPPQAELQRTFCYGVVTRSIQEYASETKKIAIGNTGVEALSAYLATELAGGQNPQKALIEEQLDFLSVQPRLVGNILDLDAKLLEGLHESEFNAVYGGSQWIIQKDLPQNNTSRLPQEKAKVKLPPELAGKLGELNRLQREYDRTAQEITDIQQQISSNWSTYILHPQSPETARQFSETGDIQLLNEKIADSKRLLDNLEPKRKALENDISQHNQQEGAEHYILKQTAAARYWQPKEPVVLIVGEGEPAFVKMMEEPLECKTVQGNVDEQTVTKQTLDNILQEVDRLPALAEPQPWSIFLEWEVEFLPLSAGSSQERGLASLAPGAANKESGQLYPRDFITRNFALTKKAVELHPKRKPVQRAVEAPGRGRPIDKPEKPEPGEKPVESNQIYFGSSILTPHAGIQLKQSIAGYLQTLIDAPKKEAPVSRGLLAGSATWHDRLSRFKPEAADRERFQEWLSEKIDDISRDYEAGLKPARGISAPQRSPDPISTFLNAFKTLQNQDFLSQALSGFNDLLIHRQTPQLSSADPLSLSEPGASRPANEFNPIRAGTMRLLHLRLVDTFGRRKELPCDEVIASEHLRGPADGQNRVTLPPRLVQPARLNFRWLAAGSGIQAQDEMNAHPATNPVYGWLLPNFLDNSLMVYDQAGVALGSLAAVPDVQWKPAPGSSTARVEEIANSTLKKVIQHLSNPVNPKGFLEGFIHTMDDALENITPDHPDEPVGLALLMGHPIAVVRAALWLEVFGRPAIRQDWSATRPPLNPAARDRHSFGGVSFPVRLGEAKQLNDGLIGYWLDNELGELKDSFCAPLTLAVDNPPKTLIMLLDPHGKVHATCGILPVKAIDIPADQYSDLLEHLAVTFLAGPILTDRSVIKLPMPAEPGYSWTWLDRREGTWKEVSHPTPQEAFAAPQEIREVLLKLTPGEELPGGKREDSGQVK